MRRTIVARVVRSGLPCYSVPEPRAGMLGLGFGWDLEGMRLDVAILRRTLERVDRPDSYDDRVVVSAQVAF